jgi:parallel beta-helix repeat protein
MRSLRITAVLVFCVAMMSARVASAQSPLAPGIDAPDRLDDRRRAVIRFTVGSPLGYDTRSISAQMYTGGVVVEWHAPGWICAPLWPPGSYFFSCQALTPDAAQHSPIVLTVEYHRDALRTGISLNVQRGSGAPPFNLALQHAYYRDYEVTTTADAGPGSLRDAITRSNLGCSERYVSPPCRIAMRLPAPVPAAGWFTLAPLSALPVITAVDVAIDGEAQTALTGDTNPHGPEIFIDGMHVPRTNALQLIGGAQQVRGLAIGGFDHAIVSARPEGSHFEPRRIERNYLGVDPSGTHAVPNVRGMMLFNFGGVVEHNVIGGNVRSGIYCARYAGVSIRNNRIGVAAASAAPIPNGASGVFFYDSTSGEVEGNVIANSGEFGVSVSRGANVLVLQNTFARNGSAAIDVGLDGPTGDVVQITSARPVSASVTWIEAKASLPPLSGPGVVGRTVTVFLYANNSDVAEGERFLGSYRANADGSFSLPVSGDLRGKWISASMRIDTHYVFPEGNHTASRTTEFGPRVRV